MLKNAALSRAISESRVNVWTRFMQRHVTHASVITGVLNQPIIYLDYLDQYRLFWCARYYTIERCYSRAIIINSLLLLSIDLSKQDSAYCFKKTTYFYR